MSLVSIKDIKDALQAQFITDWAGRTAVAYDNDEFLPPEDNTPWVRFNIQFISGRQVSLGSVAAFRHEGFVNVQVFTPAGNAKTSDNDTYCMAVLDMFEGKSTSGIKFRNSGVRLVGNDGKWFQQNVHTEFMYDIIK